MEDIGMSPDYRSMSPDQKNYETETREGDVCPFCEEPIECITDEELEILFWKAIQEERVEDEICRGCLAELEITYQFVPLANYYSAQIDTTITATKRVA